MKIHSCRRPGALVAIVGAAALASGCANLAERGAPYSPDQEKFSDLLSAKARFDTQKEQAKTSSTAIRSYLDAGVTLSNTACEIWFTQLAKTERGTNLTKDLMNVVGNLILGISGINGADPTSLGRGALGLSAANTAFEVYRADILLGSIEDLRFKIREDRGVSATALLAMTNVTYDAAQRNLLDYHQLCSVERIKVLLKTSLASVKFESPDVTLGTAVDRAKAQTLVAGLRAQLNVSVDTLLQDEDLLYQTYLALIVYNPAGADDPDVAKDARKNQVVAGYLTIYNNLVQPKKDEVMRSLHQVAVLLKFGNRLKLDLSAGATKNQLEAMNDLDDAEKSLQRSLEALNADADVRRIFSVPPAAVNPGEFAAELLKTGDAGAIRAGMDRVIADKRRQRAAPESAAAVKDAADRARAVQEASLRLRIASAASDRARVNAQPSYSVIPKIVPIDR